MCALGLETADKCKKKDDNKGGNNGKK